jgi:hypothetical protein
MEVYKSVNIVLINTPHRYDLLSTSYVNKEVVKFNRQIKKIIKMYSKADLMEVELQRKHLTRHGQYLNLSGVGTLPNKTPITALFRAPR